MNVAAKILAPLALGLTLVPSLLFLARAISEPAMKALMLVGAVLWFVAAPFWMKGGSG